MNEKIAVIGGGQMGSQIAALAAMAGYKTNIYDENKENLEYRYCLLYTSPSPRDATLSRMPSSA